MKVYSVIVTIIALIFVSLCFYLNEQVKQSKETLSKHENERKYFLQRIELMNYEKELRARSLGRRLNINYSKIKSLGSNKPEIERSKILIIAAPEFVNFSNKKFYRFYTQSKTHCALIISSPDTTFTKRVFYDMVTEVPVYVDVELQFSQLLNLAENETVVLVKSSKGIILYSYVVEEGNPLKDAEERNLILGLIKTN